MASGENIVLRFMAETAKASFDAVNNAVHSIENNFKTMGRVAVGAFGSMKQALGDLGENVTTVKGIVSGFLQGGIWGAGAQAASAAIGFISNYFKEQADKMVEAAKAAADRQQKIWDGLLQKLAKVPEALRRIVDAQKRAAQAMAGAHGAKNAENQHAAAMLGRENAIENAKAQLGGASQLQLAEKRLAQVTEENAAKRANAAEAEEMAQKELVAAQRDREKVAKESDKLWNDAAIRRNTAQDLRKSGETKRADELDALAEKYEKEAIAADKSSRDRVEDAQKRLDAARRARELQDKDAELAELSAKQAVKSAKSAEEKERQLAKEKAEAEERRKAEADLRAAETARAKAEKEAADKLREQTRQRAKELSDQQRTAARDEAAAQQQLSEAQQKLATAWNWYRNKDLMAAQINEEKENAAAEKQFEKDFARLTSKHRDWRTLELGKLSVDEEAVRRVGLAREEKTAAERAVIETAENTRKLSEKLDELLSMKGGE